MNQLKELVGFLKDQRTPVRLEATKMMAGLTGDAKQAQLLTQLPVVPPLISMLMDDDQNIRRFSLIALINLCENLNMRNKMLEGKAVDKAMEALRSKQTTENHGFCVTLLSNLSVDPKGAKQIMQEGTPLQGLNLLRLLQWFFSASPQTESVFQYVANVLTNVTTRPSGQTLVMDPDRKLLPALVKQLASANKVRQTGVLTTFRNCFVSTKNHARLLDREVGVYGSLLALLAHEQSEIDEEDSQCLPVEVKQAIKPGKKVHPDPAVRKMVLEIIITCARYKPSRQETKAQGTYFVLREAHKWEVEHGTKELDDMFEDTVMYYLMDEDKEDDGSKQVDNPGIDVPASVEVISDKAFAVTGGGAEDDAKVLGDSGLSEAEELALMQGKGKSKGSGAKGKAEAEAKADEDENHNSKDSSDDEAVADSDLPPLLDPGPEDDMDLPS